MTNKKEYIESKEELVEALKKDDWAFKSASPSLTKDKEAILIAIESNPFSVMENADKEFLKNNIEIVFEAVKRDLETLVLATDILSNKKSDLRKITSYAVNKNGYTLSFASEELRNDRQIVLDAVKNKPLALGFASERLQKDKELLSLSLNDPKMLSYMCEDYFDDGVAQEFLSYDIEKGMKTINADEKYIIEEAMYRGWNCNSGANELVKNVDLLSAAIKKYYDSAEKIDSNVVITICDLTRECIKIDESSSSENKKYFETIHSVFLDMINKVNEYYKQIDEDSLLSMIQVFATLNEKINSFSNNAIYKDSSINIKSESNKKHL